jgi:predicted nucleic acid-binding protein
MTDSRVFVDTNVIVYAHDVTAGEKRVRASRLLTDLWESGLGCISIQVLQELFVTVTAKVPRPLPPATAAELVSDLAKWTVHSPGPDDVTAAIEIHQQENLSFWDSMIVRSAAALGCDILCSEDLNSGQRYAGVLVVNPFS